MVPEESEKAFQGVYGLKSTNGVTGHDVNDGRLA